MKKLILKRYGLYNPTEVEYGEKIIVTNQLDIKSTCDLWKWYFGLKCYEKIPLYIENERDYNSMEQKRLASVKSVKELFYENGFEIKLLKDHTEIVSKFKLYISTELCDREEVRKETAKEILQELYNRLELVSEDGLHTMMVCNMHLFDLAKQFNVELEEEV